jgi:hypothetical protein
MGVLQKLVFDRWTALSHKEPVGEDGRRSKSYRPPSWIGPENERRLAAYTVLRAYVDNAARAALRAYGIEEEERSEHREYGDAALLVSTVADAVLGDDVQIVVSDADVEPPPEPELPPRPEPLLDETDEIAKRIFDVQQLRWDTEAAEAIDEWEQQLKDRPKALARQQWLRKWAEDEQFLLALIEVEHEDTTALGDGVFAVGWSSAKKRPVLDVYDPGFYFPVLDPVRRDRYPRRVHVAWEYEDRLADGSLQRFVHRITWELRELTQARKYPWRTEPSTTACFMTEATWPLEDLDGKAVDEFSPAGAKYATNEDETEIRDLDLGIDFIPLVHVPNTPARKEHFGQSILASIAQLLDELQAADTDLAKAARKVGFPVLAVSGAGAGTTAPKTVGLNGEAEPDEVVTYGPGTVFKLSENGKMDALDLSAGLTALGDYVEALLDRLSQNSGVPSEAMGRVKASQVPSGIAVVVLWNPIQRLVRKMRLVRTEKLPLIPEFVQRFAQANGMLPAGENPRADIAFGSFMPTDRDSVVTMIMQLLAEHGISRLTALRWLVDAGVEIGDLAEELRRIESEDFEGADKLDVVIGPDAAADYLGRKREPSATRPVRLQLDPNNPNDPNGPQPQPPEPQPPAPPTPLTRP